MNHKIIFAIFTILISNGFFGQSQTEIEIIPKYINYNQERKALSIQYLKDRHGILQEEPTIVPKFIILHYTAGGTLQSNFDYFNKVKMEDARVFNKKQSSLNVSAHYLVDRDGKIYQLVPDTLFARHSIGLNYCAIGVENVGSKTQPLTNAQVSANAALIRYLKSKHEIEFLIGHNEYLRFKNSKYWKETNSKYVTGKEDPGKEFMDKVRNLVRNLQLKSEP